MFLAGCGGPCFNSSAQKAEAGKQISKFEGSLVYRMSYRTASATQRKPVLGQGVGVGVGWQVKKRREKKGKEKSIGVSQL
jgi:hypothetical protein